MLVQGERAESHREPQSEYKWALGKEGEKHPLEQTGVLSPAGVINELAVGTPFTPGNLNYDIQLSARCVHLDHLRPDFSWPHVALY